MTAHTGIYPKLDDIKFENRAFINGNYLSSASGKSFTTVNPATGNVLAEVASCDEEDVDRTVTAARKVFEAGDWSRAAPFDRKKVLLKFAELVEDNLEELALLETLDSGKPITDARNVDIPDTVETIRWHAEAIDKLYGQVSPTPHDVVSTIEREPIGVVGGVIPWNFPLYVAAWKFAPALAGGNSVILKPAEQTSLSLIRLAELAAAAGLPDGTFNVIPGLGTEAGRAIGLHSDIDAVSFTGSVEVGRYFLEYAAKSNLKRIVLECGGKSPAIVLPDVKDLSPVVENIAEGILFCQGENCSAGSRLIVHEDIKDKLLDALKDSFRNWKVGNPLSPDTRVGAMIEEDHLKKVLGFIERGRAEGGNVTVGGRRVLEETGGYFVEPTIIEDVDNRMTVAREEIFGPVLSVIPFSGEQEAVQIANDTNYGLASSLYTDDLNAAHRVARSIRAGTVSVNCFSEGDYAVPFGGYKESGFGGKDKGLAAHDQYTEQKSIWIQLR